MGKNELSFLVGLYLFLIINCQIRRHNIVEDDHNDVYDLQIVRNDSEVHEVKFKRKIDTNDPEDKILKEVVEIYILTDEELAAEENEVIRQTELPQATSKTQKNFLSTLLITISFLKLKVPRKSHGDPEDAETQ